MSTATARAEEGGAVSRDRQLEQVLAVFRFIDRDGGLWTFYASSLREAEKHARQWARAHDLELEAA